MSEHVQGKSSSTFCDLTSEVTHPETVWEGTSQGHGYEELGIPAAIWEAGHHRELSATKTQIWWLNADKSKACCLEEGYLLSMAPKDRIQTNSQRYL